MHIDSICWARLGTRPPTSLVDVGSDRGMSAVLARATWVEQSAVVKISRAAARGARELQALHVLSGCPDVPRLLGSYREEDRVVLLLEDLGGARAGDILVGVSADEAFAVVDLLGRLHRRHATRPVPAGWSTGPPVWRDTTAAHIEAFLERHPHAFGPRLRRLPAVRPTEAAVLASSPVTLLHADAHLDNFLFRPQPLLLDWETARIGPGAIDVVRFLMEGVHTQVRRPVHDRLLSTWIRSLDGVSPERAMAWLRAAAWYSLNAMVPHHATVHLDALPPRMRAVHHHCARQALDLAADLLGHTGVETAPSST